MSSSRLKHVEHIDGLFVEFKNTVGLIKKIFFGERKKNDFSSTTT